MWEKGFGIEKETICMLAHNLKKELYGASIVRVSDSLRWIGRPIVSIFDNSIMAPERRQWSKAWIDDGIHNNLFWKLFVHTFQPFILDRRHDAYAKKDYSWIGPLLLDLVNVYDLNPKTMGKSVLQRKTKRKKKQNGKNILGLFRFMPF